MQAWHQRYKYQIAFHSIKLLDHLSLIHTSCRALRLLQRARPSQAVTGRCKKLENFLSHNHLLQVAADLQCSVNQP